MKNKTARKRIKIEELTVYIGCWMEFYLLIRGNGIKHEES